MHKWGLDFLGAWVGEKVYIFYYILRFLLWRLKDILSARKERSKWETTLRTWFTYMCLFHFSEIYLQEGLSNNCQPRHHWQNSHRSPSHHLDWWSCKIREVRRSYSWFLQIRPLIFRVECETDLLSNQILRSNSETPIIEMEWR